MTLPSSRKTGATDSTKQPSSVPIFARSLVITKEVPVEEVQEFYELRWENIITSLFLLIEQAAVVLARLKIFISSRNHECFALAR